MKRLLLSLLITTLSIGFVNAQQYNNLALQNAAGATKTSFLNADTAYAYAPIKSLRTASFAATVTVTQATGTTGGSITWQGSVNGTKWATLQTATTISGTTTTSGYSVSGGVPYNRYRALVITSGTQTSTLEGTYIYKQ
jgi:hypothetical protein